MTTERQCILCGKPCYGKTCRACFQKGAGRSPSRRRNARKSNRRKPK